MLRVTVDPSKPPMFQAVGCICGHGDDILLLRRAPDRPYPNAWGIPTGTVEPGEAPDHAVVRELHEETRIIRSLSNLSYIADYYVLTAELSFQYTLFYAHFDRRPSVAISLGEHVEYRWVEWSQVTRLELVPDLAECLKLAQAALRPPKQLPLFDLPEDTLAEVVGDDEHRVEANISPNLRVLPRPRLDPPIVVIGPSGAGKSTIVARTAAELPPLRHTRADVMRDRTSRQYKYLTRFFSGDASFAFICLVEALANRYWTGLQACDPGMIADEWIYSTLAYAKAERYRGGLADYEFQTFYSLYLAFASWLPLPKLVIHLTAQPDVLRRRIRRRGRALEQQSHDENYLRILGAAFDEVAAELGIFTHVERLDTSGVSIEAVVHQTIKIIDDCRLTGSC